NRFCLKRKRSNNPICLLALFLSGLILPLKSKGAAVMKTYPEFPNLFVIDHPLVQHKLTLMRSVDCSVQIFRDLLKEIAMLMGYEMTRDLPTEMKAITTPLAEMQAPVLSGKQLAIVPILRAGLGMSDGLFDL